MNFFLVRALASLLLGPALGSAAWASDDFRDMGMISAAVEHVLENMKNGQPYEWSNPDTGNGGTVIVERTYFLDPNTPCREYRRTSADGLDVLGTGCRTADGRWRLNERDSPPPPGGGVAGTSPDPATAAPRGAGSGAPDAEPPRAAEAPPAPPAPAEADKGKRRLGRSGPPAATAHKASPAEPKMAPEAGAPEPASDEDEAGFETTRAETVSPPMPRPRPAGSSGPTLAVSLPTRSEE